MQKATLLIAWNLVELSLIATSIQFMKFHAAVSKSKKLCINSLFVLFDNKFWF